MGNTLIRKVMVPANMLEWRQYLARAYTTFINGRLAILKNLYVLQLKKELNTKKDSVKMGYNGLCSFRVIFSFDEKLCAFEFWLKHESQASEAKLWFLIQMS